jgi:hypothetical protein
LRCARSPSAPNPIANNNTPSIVACRCDQRDMARLSGTSTATMINVFSVNSIP